MGDWTKDSWEKEKKADKWEVFSESIVHIADIMLRHWPDTLDRLDKDKEFSVDFLPELDDMIWGLKRRELVIIGARTGMGKSTFMLNLADTFARQAKKVIFFSFEMSKEVCLERLMSAHLRVDNRLIARGKHAELYKGNIGGIKEKEDAYYSELQTRDFILVEKIGRNLPEFKEVMTVIPDGPPDVVFIDYGNMVETMSGRTKKQSLDEYTGGLRALAKKYNFCVVVGAQINRSTHAGNKIRPPRIWELKDSGDLEQMADMIFLLHWEYFYGEAPAEEKYSYIVDVAKNRNGPTGVFNCEFHPQFSRITEKSKKLIY